MKKFLLTIFLLLTFMTISVSAKELELNVNKEEVGIGEKITISIDSYEGKIELDYDKNVFDAIDMDSFNIDVSQDDATFYLDESSDLKIDLKVKEDAPDGKTTIKVSYGDETLSKEITIDGESSSYLGVIFLVIAICFAVYGITYYVKNKDDIEKEQIIMLSISIILTLVFLGLSIFNFITNRKEKEEVNEANYTILVEDTEDKEDEKDKEIGKNEDNKSETTKPVNVIYNVKLKDYLANVEVIEKEKNVTITFSVDITPYAQLKSVVINNKTYPAKKLGDHYQVIVKSSNKYGNEKYTITDIVLQNGRKLAVEKKQVEVYVLKATPDIKNIEIYSREETPVLNFDVEDPDHSFVSGKVIMSEITGPSVISVANRARQSSGIRKMASDGVVNPGDILEADITKAGHNSFEVPKLEEGMSYDLVITLNYSLDEKKIDEKYTSETEEEKRETFEREYNFKLSEGKLNSPVKEEDELKLTFKNGAYSYTDIEKIEIDGVEYEVTKDESGVYSVNNALTKCTQKGTCKIHITKVLLTTESGEPKEIECDESIEYIYLKKEPTIVSFNATLNENQLTGTYEITDVDATVTGGKLKLEGPDGEVTFVDLTKDDLSRTTVTKEVQLAKAGDYKVTLVVYYDLGDEKVLEEEKESDSTIHQKIVAKIKSVTVPSERVERGKTADLYFEIESNTEETLLTITIDGKDCTASKQEDGTYKVTVDVPSDGEGLTRTLVVTKLTYSEEIILEESKNVVINILKMKPSITSFNLSAAGGEISGIFTLNDIDNAVTEIKYTIDGKTVTLGADARTFTDDTIRQAGNYTVQLILVYNLGNGKILEDVIQDAEVKVELDATIIDASITPDYVEKGESVTITYTVIHNTSSTLSKIKVNGTDYPAQSIGDNKYTVEIQVNLGEEAGEKSFEATNLIFEDKEDFKLKENKTVTATVLKSEPTIGDFTAEYAKETKTLTGNITVSETDEDTISGGTLTITGPCFDEPKVVLVSIEKLIANTITIESLDLSKVGEYKLSLIVTYDLGDGNAISIEKTTTVTIELEVKSVIVKGPQIVNKNGEIQLVYQVTDNTDEKITDIKINGTNYKAVYNDIDDNYTVTLTAESVVGLQEYSASALTYSNIADEQDISSLSAKASVYVLKEKPTIGNITYSSTDTNTEISVEITDSDNASTKKTIEFTKVDGGAPISFSIENGKADIRTLPNGLYNVVVKVEYDLDDTNNFENTTGVETKEQSEMRIVTNYDVKVSDLKLNNITPKDTTLEFNIQNDTGIEITAVKVVDGLGLEYTSTLGKLENTFTAKISNPSERVELTISEVTFANGVKQAVTLDDKVLINKKTPTATVEASVIENTSINATIKTTDEDSSISKDDYYAVLMNIDDNEEVQKQKLTGTTSETVTFTEPLDATIRYRVDVIADYDLVDGNTYQSKTLCSSNIVVLNAEITLKDTRVNKQYVYPTSHQLTVYFDFESNVKLAGVIKTINIKTTEIDSTDGYFPVGEITDSGVDYNLYCGESTKEDAKYKTTCNVSYKASKNSGVATIQAQSFTYLENEKETISNGKQIKIDIQKWRPEITYRVVNNVDDGTITFYFKFKDITMLKPIVENEDGSKVYMNVSYGLDKQQFTIENSDELKANHEYSVVFTGVQANTAAKRIDVEVKYDPYHHIVNSVEEQAEVVSIISFIHYFHRQDEISINDIELVKNGEIVADDNYVVYNDDDVRLAFTIDGDFVPASVFITTDGKNAQVYNVITLEREDLDSGYVTYVTKESLKGLEVGTHTIQITKLFGSSENHDITRYNAIELEIKAREDAVITTDYPTKLDISLNESKQEALPDLGMNEEEQFEDSNELSMIPSEEITDEIEETEKSSKMVTDVPSCKEIVIEQEPLDDDTEEDSNKEEENPSDSTEEVDNLDSFDASLDSSEKIETQ